MVARACFETSVEIDRQRVFIALELTHNGHLIYGLPFWVTFDIFVHPNMRSVFAASFNGLVSTTLCPAESDMFIMTKLGAIIHTLELIFHSILFYSRVFLSCCTHISLLSFILYPFFHDPSSIHSSSYLIINICVVSVIWSAV